MKNQLAPSKRPHPHELPIHVPAHEEFKHFLQHFWNALDFPHHQDLSETEPKIEVSESDDAVNVLAELPGINEKDIDLEISSDGYLTISGERKQQTEHKGKNSYFSEMSYGMIKRTVPLPWDLNFDQADANYDNGVLEITIPKTTTEKQKMKKISVKKTAEKTEN